jgi:sugar phosphate isomerase/epimerase
MPPPISVQLYSVRDVLKHDFEGTIRRIAEMGYVGVEPWSGNLGSSLQTTAWLFQELGLQVNGIHSPLPLGDDKNRVLDTMAAFNAPYLICPWLPPERFKTVESLEAVCDSLNEADEITRAAGHKLAYHNHDFEFKRLPDGKLPHEYMREWLAPTIVFEIDLYWVKVAGVDPAQTVRELGARAPLLHMKDGHLDPPHPMVAAGDGVMDFDAIMQAAGSHPEWLVVELDSCATDMMEAVEKSYRYLIAKGFARGKNL